MVSGHSCMASCFGYIELADLLIMNGVDVNIKDNDNY